MISVLFSVVELKIVCFGHNRESYLWVELSRVWLYCVQCDTASLDGGFTQRYSASSLWADYL